LLAITAYVGLQLALLVLSEKSRVRSQGTIAAAALTLVSGLLLAPLSHLEHRKSARPSFLISFYLVVTTFFDIARVRTQWLLGENNTNDNNAIAAVSTTSLLVKCLILVLEAVGKRSLLPSTESEKISIESTSGLFSRSSFWWLNSLLLQGSKNVLTTDVLPPIQEKLASDNLGKALQYAWDNCEIYTNHEKS
jgi:hypothetical protein